MRGKGKQQGGNWKLKVVVVLGKEEDRMRDKEKEREIERTGKECGICVSVEGR